MEKAPVRIEMTPKGANIEFGGNKSFIMFPVSHQELVGNMVSGLIDRYTRAGHNVYLNGDLAGADS